MAAAPNVVVKNLRNGSLSVKDGTAVTPLSIVFPFVRGGLTMKFKASGKEAMMIKDRGVNSHLIEGDDAEFSWSIEGSCKELIQTTDAPVTPYEAFSFTGGAAAWVTTNDDGGAVKTLDLVLTVAGVVGTQKAEIITIPKVYDVDVEFAEAPDGNTLKLSGKSKATRPTIAKAT